MSNTPVRLHKVEENNVSFLELVLEWLIAHPNITFLLLFICLAGLLAILFNVLCGMCTIESGVMRNFLNGGV